MLTKNQEIARIFREIGDYLSMDDSETFRIYAYRKASAVLDSLEQDLEELYHQGGLKKLIEIPGIGQNMASLIKEYLEKGKIRYHQELKKKTPVDLETLMKIEGLGSKTVKSLYQELKVRNIKELKKAVQEDKVAPLFNFGKKKQEKILQGIEFLEKNQGKFFLGEVLPLAQFLQEKIGEIKEVEKVSLAGSLRRRKETIGDLDILISGKNPKKIMEQILSFSGKVKIINQGETKLSLKTEDNLNIDFRVVMPESYGSALQYFTGSKEHNIQLRKRAIKKGFKVNEYGIFRNKKKVGGREEKEIYSVLGLPWIPPEIREGTKEFSFNEFDLIELEDIKGDLHCHSNWSDGKNTIKEMAQEALSLGYSYIGIADHAKDLAIVNGLDEKRLLQQRKEIDGINLGIKILQGCEVNILKNGSLDISQGALKKLDFVIVGIHSHFKMPQKEMTQRIIRAMENPLVDILSHPTGRILGIREEYNVDFNKILEKARQTKTILEINSSPQRLDLNDSKIYRAKEMKIKMIVNSDAHHRNQMKVIECGVSQARRGWADKKDIVNSFPWRKIKS
jgi:DNA polymerase (family X)